MLLPYQVAWNNETAQFAIIEKSRRIGLSWSDAAESVLYAAEGRGNVYYQSFNQDMTQTYIQDCAEWAKKMGVAAGEVEETLITNEREQVLRYRLTLDGGKFIQALPSNPRVLRSKGKPGDRYVLDEAAFCDDLAELLKAATAMTQWGGLVRILSTHNGEANPFNKLVSEVREGKHPQYALHRVTLDDAIEQGLAKRVFSVTGQRWYDGAAADWRNKIVSGYLSTEAANEELFCIPAKSGGAWLQWQWIRRAGHEHAGNPDFYGNGLTYIGVDIARRNDLWVAVVLERVGDVLWVRELITARGISFAEQHSIVARLDAQYRPVRYAVDQTGMGEAVVEQMQDNHGKTRVEGVLLSAPRRLAVATSLREAMEDDRLRMPDDEALRQDLHSIKAEVGQTGAPRLIADTKGTDSHADRFWALALACSAANEAPVKIEFRSTGRRVSSLFDDDTGFGPDRFDGF